MNDCIFCKIIKKEIPASIVYEDEKTLAFLDIAPAQPKGGHTLVLPKNHYELVNEMEDEDAKAVMLTIKRISKALLKFGEGMNIFQNNKEVAGQLIPHVHFHLVPRFKNDNFVLFKENEKWENARIKEMANKIKELLK